VCSQCCEELCEIALIYVHKGTSSADSTEFDTYAEEAQVPFQRRLT